MHRLLRLLATAGLALVLVLAASPAAHADPEPTPPEPTIAGACTSVGLPAALCEAGADFIPGGGVIEAVAPVVGAVVDFVQNPLGYLAAAVTGAAVWVMGQIALFTNASTQPDLTAAFWIDAYRKGLAIGTVLLGIALLVEIVQVARRRVGPDELMETVAIWLPAWFGGVLFGPPLAQFLINGAGFLTDGIIHSMTGFSGGDALSSISSAAANAGIGGGATGAGQAFMSLIVGLGVLVAAVAVYVSVCLQSVIVYLASAVFAIGWVWIVTQRHRETAWRIPRLFLGLVFGKALLFFLLGICLAIATAATAIQGDGAGRDFALVVMGIAGMLIAAFAPLWLLRHAPVIPGTSTSRDTEGFGSTGSRAAGTARGGRQAASTGGSMLNALADRRARKSAKSASPQPSSSSSAAAGAASSAADRSGAAAAGGSGPQGRADSSPSATSGAGAEPASSSSTGRAGRPNPAASRAGGNGRPAGDGASAGSTGRRSSPSGGTPEPAGASGQWPGWTSTQSPQPRRRTGGGHIPPQRRHTGGGSRSATAQQAADHEYVPPSEPPVEENA